jgi:hypothetical protein
MRLFRLQATLLFGFGLLVALWLGLGMQTARLAGAAEPAISNTSQAPLAQVVLTPTKDNTIYEGTTSLRSNGVGEYIFAGKNGSGVALRGLLAFDIAGALPPSTTILSVTLRLDSQPPSKNAGPMAVHLHRLERDWGEGTSNAPQGEAQGDAATPGDATWRHTFFDTEQWTTVGGDFAPTASATTTVNGDGLYSWSSPALLTDVQGWLANPTTNFGWILIGDASQSSADIKRFASRDNTNGAALPELIITYEGPANETRLIYLPLVQN